MLLTARTRATREGRHEEREPFRFGMMVATKMESEIALAKRCALGFIKSAYAGPSAAGLDILSNVPWLAVFRMASAESCLPALCDCILSHDGSELDEVKSLLKLFSERGRDEKASLVRILDDTVARLRAEGVPVIALKGAAFLASSDLYTRSMLDIDVLIRPDDKNKAVGILIRNGYSVLTRNGPYDHLEHHHAPPMLDPSKTIAIELHTRLSPNSNKDPVLADMIFENSSTCFVIPIPHDTHRVVHLIL